MNRLTFIYLLLLGLLSCTSKNEDFSSESDNNKVIVRGYTTDADSVYFNLHEDEINNFIDISETNFFIDPYSFNIGNWKNMLKRKREITINSVHVIGNFNNFQLTDLLTKKGKIWQLSLSKADVKGKSGQFGYIVNGKYFITPFIKLIKNYKIQVIEKFSFHFINLVWLTYLFYENEQLGYTIDNDSIYFVFDPKDYVSTTDEVEGFEKIIDPSKIDQVEVTGSFSNWKKRLVLTKINDIYITTLALDSTFKNWGEFKYIINKRKWVTPPFVVTNKIGKVKNDNNFNYTFRTKNKENIRGYYLKGDSVIFEWQLEKLQLLNFYHETVVDSHKVKNLYLHGVFNTEDKENKRLMQQIGDKRFRIAYPVSSFEKGRDYTFIFYMNGALELIPPHDASNVKHSDAFAPFQTMRFNMKL
ncbi:hypothetical protein EI427_01370 [Flammeovirga pectinis]|uniref:DUF4185 domain-containing protein n=1 Tax=Flammeovirga pectinis TaxID=2494373 RepID=A0A3Q9FKW3_9BACT|nr:hypothetical protein [Flammeovirga pectinis]AZQ60909.1 hypothetical protein EI427_01370 [Flammeovirga pectinis]